MIRMVLAVTCGGVIGTLLRFAISTWVSTQWPRQFYLATLAVNLIGCLLIGYLYATFLLRPEISPELRGALIIGFLGALTTFSSFSLDALRLLESGQIAIAFGYLACSVLGGLLAAWVGLALARL
ncbi:fluoride efflux transporter CrcB [Stutzerimonas degradans]|uniref:Fluoride-specific ion channel FluC n=1 Tax=Stutzerimonas degradans TaxID=2968968 RepID=A0A8E2U1L8_9GAMM|nr:fluoride efflux transporter CrcB [Stutzerimonas degradans]MCQ4276222.1 fluoride efflux transporter CrcB [Stutzerimonas degradans]PNF76900.1 fluoride efflux transporter CrcB [Stutzerimonas degradans]QPT22330.1 fluoride efflux transporter CrcB [Stutzerimonas degradans]